MKQANTITVAGKEQFGLDLTLRLYLTPGRARAHGDKMEAARRIIHWRGTLIRGTLKDFKEGASAKVLAIMDDIISKNIVAGDDAIAHAAAAQVDYTLAAWHEEVAKGLIKPDSVMEVLLPNTKTTASTRLGEEITPHISRDQSDGVALDHRARGQMYYSKRRDEPMRDESSRIAPLLSINKAASKSVQEAKRSRLLSTMNTQIVNDWVRFMRSHEGYFDPKTTGNLVTPEDFWEYARISKDLINKNPDSARLANKLEAQREVHNRFMRDQNYESRAIDWAIRNIVWGIESHGTFPGSDFIARKSLDMMSKTPLNAIRGYNYHTTLGMGDTGQITLQTQQAFIAQQVDPKNGVRAFMMSRVMMHMMMNRSPELLARYANGVYRMGGFSSPSEFKAVVLSFRASGYKIVGREQMELSTSTPNIGGGKIKEGFKGMLHYGTIPVRWAEMYNKVTAWQLGWQKMKRLNPNLNYDMIVNDIIEGKPALPGDSFDFRQGLFVHANDFYDSMTSASKAGWQRTAFSIPLQFHQFNAHFLQKMMPKAFGGNPRLSTQELRNVWLAGFLMYGTKGVIGGGSIYAAWRWMTKDEQPLGPMAERFIQRGMIDAAIFGLTGAETDFAQRAAVPASWAEFIMALKDGRRRSFLDVALGMTGTSGHEMMDVFMMYYRLARAEQSVILSRSASEIVFPQVLRILSSADRAYKAYWIFNRLHVIDPITGQETLSATQAESVMAFLGIPLANEQELYDLWAEKASNEYIINQAVKDLTALKITWSQQMAEGAETGDYTAARLTNDTIAGYMEVFRDKPGMQQDIIVFSDIGAGINVDSLTRALEEAQAYTGRETTVPSRRQESN